MGMGHSAAYADTVEESFIEEIAPMELGNFKSALEKEGNSIEEFAEDNKYGGDLGICDFGDEVNQAYDELLATFKEVTGWHPGKIRVRSAPAGDNQAKNRTGKSVSSVARHSYGGRFSDSGEAGIRTLVTV